LLDDSEEMKEQKDHVMLTLELQKIGSYVLHAPEVKIKATLALFGIIYGDIGPIHILKEYFL
jgi:hypothetical protein